MKVKNVDSGSELEYLYNHSALTWEGLVTTEDSLSQLSDWLKSKDALTSEPSFYVITGKFMSDYYKLTGTNRYQDDLNIVSVDPECINLGKVIIARFESGGRWFDDIVDNNASHEEEKKRKKRGAR